MFAVQPLSPVSHLQRLPGCMSLNGAQLGSQFHIPHGLANALLICNVIRYNANDNPTKQLH
ncbi:hypothetical protein ACNKHL_07430 [Shigella flexneri]